jgi:hypothetical protein
MESEVGLNSNTIAMKSPSMKILQTTALRTLAIIQIAAMINFFLYRSLVEAPTLHTWFGFFVLFEFLSAFFLVMMTASPAIAINFLMLELMVSVVNVLINVYMCIVVFSPTYTVPRTSHLFWSVAFFVVLFLAINLGVVLACSLLQFLFREDDWVKLIEEAEIEAEMDVTINENPSRRKELGRRIIYLVVEFLVPAETVTYAIYFVILATMGLSNYNITGWVFLLQVVDPVIAIVWHENYRAYTGLTAKQKQIGVALTLSGKKNEPPSPDSLLVASFCIFIVDAAQLVYVQENDHVLLVTMRAFLCVMAGLYWVTILVATFQYSPPPKYVVMFYGVQFFVSLLLVVELFWIVSYFCFWDSTKTVLPDTQPLYWNIAHTLTVLTAIALVFVTARPLDAIAGLWVVAGIIMAGDIINVGLMPIGSRTAAEYFIQAIFMLISLLYIVVCWIMWVGARDTDGELYMKAVEKERYTFKAYQKLFDFSLDNLVTEEKMNLYNIRSAERVYYIITSCIKTVSIIELVLVVFYTIILAVNNPSGTTLWYQWFYMIHYVSVFAGFGCVSFELPMHTALLFLIVMSTVCLVVDAIEMGFLATLVTDGEISIQSFFLMVDVLQIVFFTLCTYRTTPISFAYLTVIEKLPDRLYLRD